MTHRARLVLSVLSALSVLVVVVGCGILLACAPNAGDPGEEREGSRPVEPDASSDAAEPSADIVEIVRGVPSRGRDPAIVAIAVGDEGFCTGTLISPRLVLTARHCTSKTVERLTCPSSGVQVRSERPPATLGILAGDDVASARRVASGLTVVAPSGVTLCDADIAVLVLDEEVTEVKPLPIRSRGAATDDRVRAVGFGRNSEDEMPPRKLVREHVRVVSVSPAEFVVGEATCQGDSGGPALDQDTGEILGVVSRGGPSCEGAGVHNVYTRVDAYAWLVEEAFARLGEIIVAEKRDAGASDPSAPAAKKGTKQKPPSDVGGPCKRGADCSAGVCIADGERRYCSRPCGPGDRCPSRYHCKAVGGEASACINVR